VLFVLEASLGKVSTSFDLGTVETTRLSEYRLVADQILPIDCVGLEFISAVEAFVEVAPSEVYRLRELAVPKVHFIAKLATENIHGNVHDAVF
jgi:hypothetical protein